MFGTRLHVSAEGVPVEQLNVQKQEMLETSITLMRALALKDANGRSSSLPGDAVPSSPLSAREQACVEVAAMKALNASSLPDSDAQHDTMASWLKNAVSHATDAAKAKDVDETMRKMMAAGFSTLASTFAAHGRNAEGVIRAWNNACVMRGIAYPARYQEASKLGAIVSKLSLENPVEAVQRVAKLGEALPRPRSTPAELMATAAVRGFVVDCARRERASTAEVADAVFDHIKNNRSILVIGYAENQFAKALEFAEAPRRVGAEDKDDELSDEARSVLIKASLEHCKAGVRAYEKEPHEYVRRALEVTEKRGEQPKPRRDWRGYRFENEGIFELRARGHALLSNLDQCLEILETLPGRLGSAVARVAVDSRFAECFYSYGKSPVNFYTKMFDIMAKNADDDNEKFKRRRNRDFLYAEAVTEILRSVSFFSSAEYDRPQSENIHRDLIAWAIQVAKLASKGTLNTHKVTDYNLLTVHGCNAIFEALTKCERHEEAAKWLKAMKDGNGFQVQPQASTYNVMLKYYVAKNSHYDEMESVLIEMTNSGIKPNNQTVDYVVELHKNADNHQCAVTAVQDIFNMHNARPSPHVFVQLIVDLLVLGDHYEARRAVQVLNQVWPADPHTLQRPNSMLSDTELRHLFESYGADLYAR